MVATATVEQARFTQLLQNLDPEYQFPSRRYFTREVLLKMYTEVRDNLTTRLTNVQYFSLTTDMWSSMTCEPYMSVTIHLLEEWEMKSACLHTSYFPQDHTAEGLQDVLSSWKLCSTGVLAITTDNGANVVKADCAEDVFCVTAEDVFCVTDFIWLLVSTLQYEYTDYVY